VAGGGVADVPPPPQATSELPISPATRLFNIVRFKASSKM
jgi:hypothetical protein